jgi:hypothetical protein
LTTLARVVHYEAGNLTSSSLPRSGADPDPRVGPTPLEERLVIVYLVTSGRYSSYDVEAVFSTREKAEEYMESDRPDYHEPPCIEEYEVDEWQPRDVFWRVRFDAKSGDLIEARRLPFAVEQGGYYSAWNKNRQTGQWVYETVFANRDSNRERAIKSAYEGMMVSKNTLRYHDPTVWEELTSD